MTRLRPPARQDGFALIVMTALFVAFAMIAASIIDQSNATQQLDLQNQTRAKLSRISNALLQYYVFNGKKYPCPAAYNLLETDPSFGASIANCDSVDPLAGADVLGVGRKVLRGAVPVMALAPYGISPADAFDAWNNRIMYVIDRAMTVAAGSGSGLDRPLITEPNTGDTFQSPDYIVISYGRDGIGAIPRAQTSATVACPTPSTVLREINCGVSNSFIQYPPHTAPGFSNPLSAGTASYFDDLLVFYGVQ